MLHIYKERESHSVINLIEVYSQKFHVIMSSVCILCDKPEV
jgi:hypothetical protein